MSSKNIELSQVYSELNNKRLKNALTNNKSLLVSFLRNEPIENIVKTIYLDEIIRVTDLDEFQLNAVGYALGSKISVITGPPGTGKTQVIENILANALLRGKKVLVASKNNKAVDNVKERFDLIDDTGYFIRFGSKRYIEENTRPEMERIANLISRIDNQVAKQNFYKIKKQYNLALHDINTAKQSIRRREQLAKELELLDSQINEKRRTKQMLVANHQREINNIEQSYTDIQSAKVISVEMLNDCATKIKKLNNTIDEKFTGIFAFWNKWFSIKKYAMLLLNTFEDFPYHLKTTIRVQGIQSQVSQLCNAQDMASFCNIILLVIGRVQDFHSSISKENTHYNTLEKELNNDLHRLVATHNEKKSEHDDLLAKNNEFLNTIDQKEEWIRQNGKNILRLCIKYHLSRNGSAASINNYKSYLPNSIWDDNGYQQYEMSANRFLEFMKMCSVTSLSAKNALPLSSELFDMVIIDEASQCDVASAIPLIMRTKQLVVIGDPMQLKHISAVKRDEENEIRLHLGLSDSPYLQYAECSLWDYCRTFISNSISGTKEPKVLHCHYRCHPDIIAYSNEFFYSAQTGALRVCTNSKKLKGNPQGIVLVNVIGRQVSNALNINEAEAKKSIEIAVEEARQHPDISIGIVTPFRHQAERINRMIPGELVHRIDANTVHKYQGDEKDVMIYSLVVTDNSPNSKIHWIDRVTPNLVNVAVTRAKSTLYVVCNINYIKAHSQINKPLGYLVSRINRHNYVQYNQK